MNIESIYSSLPNLIDNIGNKQFYDQVENCFIQLSCISNIRIFSYAKADKPDVLGNKKKSALDEIYCDSAYLLDPFYNLIERGNQDDLVTLDSITRNDFELSAYYDRFYKQLGWQNETNFIVNVGNGRTICLVYCSQQAPMEAVNRELVPFLKSIKSAIRKHEKLKKHLSTDLSYTVASAPTSTHGVASTDNSWEQRFSLFGLTKREREITSYILQGYASPAIAEVCYVSEGTVKNHRKNIYRKLNIKSQCELFSKFMN